MEQHISEAALVLAEGRIYHLELLPDELADNIVVVGDPERASAFGAAFLDPSRQTIIRSHRGLVTMTGTTRRGMPVSFVTTGMGTGSVEIVVNELIALKAIDFTTRTRRVRGKDSPPVRIIRVGTSGGIQDDTPNGTVVVTRYAVGLDNTGLFYDTPLSDEKAEGLETVVRQAIDGAVDAGARFAGCIKPYVAVPNKRVAEALGDAARRRGLAWRDGITCSAAGFFTCQGRRVFKEHRPTVPELDEVLRGVEYGGLRAENFEMEISALTQITAAFDWIEVGCVCMTIANRAKETFCNLKEVRPEEVGQVAIDALEELAGLALCEM